MGEAIRQSLRVAATILACIWLGLLLAAIARNVVPGLTAKDGLTAWVLTALALWVIVPLHSGSTDPGQTHE